MTHLWFFCAGHQVWTLSFWGRHLSLLKHCLWVILSLNCYSLRFNLLWVRICLRIKWPKEIVLHEQSLFHILEIYIHHSAIFDRTNLVFKLCDGSKSFRVNFCLSSFLRTWQSTLKNACRPLFIGFEFYNIRNQ